MRRIHCTRCRRDVFAVRSSTVATVGGRKVRVWINACPVCGEQYEAPDPARVRGRRVRRRELHQERRGQLRLFGRDGT